jgi:hypothetical protein
MGREAVSQCVGSDMLVDPGGFCGPSNGFLQTTWIGMMALQFSAKGISGDFHRWEDILLLPLKWRSGVLDRQGIREGNPAEAAGEIVVEMQTDVPKMLAQILNRSIGKNGKAIFEPLPVTNNDLALDIIDILFGSNSKTVSYVLNEYTVLISKSK